MNKTHVFLGKYLSVVVSENGIPGKVQESFVVFVYGVDHMFYGLWQV